MKRAGWVPVLALMLAPFGCEEPPPPADPSLLPPEANSAFDLKVKPAFEPFSVRKWLTVWTWEKTGDVPRAVGYVRGMRWRPDRRGPVEREVYTIHDLEGRPLAVVDEAGKAWTIDADGHKTFLGTSNHLFLARKVLRIPPGNQADITDFDDKPRAVKDQEEAEGKRPLLPGRPGELPREAPGAGGGG